MIRLLVGLLGGIAIAAGAAAWLAHGDFSCFGRCAEGTRCSGARCIPGTAPEPAAPAKLARRRTHAASQPLELRAGDERRGVEGESLGRTERIDMTETGDAAKELDQEELDHSFAPAQPRIEKCITDALGDAPLASGRVEVGLRVGRSGAIERLRVEAPQLLLRRGIYHCVRGATQGLKFPASGGASVVTFPFELK